MDSNTQNPTPQSNDQNEASEQPIKPSRSILVIEDERFISELYTRALQNAGFSVKSVSDGAEALRVAVNGKFDLILLDIMLPSMNGIDMLNKMKDKHVVPPMESKIVITTNLDQKEETRAQIEKLADGYLIKAEITPKELVNFVNQIFSVG